MNGHNPTNHTLVCKETGVNFLRTSKKEINEVAFRCICNFIRAIVASFRILKPDPAVLPVLHKTDENTMAHLILGMLAYKVVSTIHHQLKTNGICHMIGRIPSGEHSKSRYRNHARQRREENIHPQMQLPLSKSL